MATRRGDMLKADSADARQICHQVAHTAMNGTTAKVLLLKNRVLKCQYSVSSSDMGDFQSFISAARG